MVWYSHPFMNFPQFDVILTVKGFHTVNEAEVDVFLEPPSFFLSCFQQKFKRLNKGGKKSQTEETKQPLDLDILELSGKEF